MKKLSIMLFVFCFTQIATAQENGKVNQDELEQAAPRETRLEVERAALIDAKKKNKESKLRENERAIKYSSDKNLETTPKKQDSLKKPKLR